LGRSGTTYDDHLRLIGKRVVDFLLVLIELFSLGVTAKALRAKIDRKSAISLQRGQFDAKFPNFVLNTPLEYHWLKATQPALCVHTFVGCEGKTDESKEKPYSLITCPQGITALGDRESSSDIISG